MTKFKISVFKFCFVLYLFINEFTLAQSSALQGGWTVGGTNDEYCNDIQQTSDGGYVFTGDTYSFGAGNADMYVVKMDASGNLQWTKTFGGTADEYGNSIQQTSDGGYVIAGYTSSYGTGLFDIYVVKLDVSGNVQWSRTVGGTADERGHSIQQTSDGGYVIGGWTKSYGSTNANAYVVRLNSLGNLIWTRVVSGTNFDSCNSIRQTSDGGYVFCGSTFSYGPNGDVYVVKLNSTGTVLWTKTFGDIAGDDANSIRQTSDGGYIIGGKSNSFGAGLTDMYILKLDASANLQWFRVIGGANWELVTSVGQTTDGGYILGGQTGSYGAGNYDGYVVKLDAAGNLLWTKTIGGIAAETIAAIQQTSDGGYIAGGFTASFGAGSRDAFIIKMDNAGNTCYPTGSGAIVSPGITNTVSGGSSSSGGSVSNGVTVGSGGTLTSICFYSIAVAQTQTITCNGGSNASASLAVSGGTSPYTYTWLPTGGNSAAASGLSSGIYTVLAADAGSIVITTTLNITQPSAITVTSSPSASVCIGSCTLINATGSGGASSLTYSWQPGNLSGATQTVCPTSQTVYTVTATDINNCTGTGATTISVNPRPGITANTTTSVLCIGQTATISATGAVSYTWSPGGPGSNIIVSPTVNTTYTLSGTDGNGCENTITITQSVSTCAGVNEQEENSVALVYPNPFKDKITVILNGGGPMIRIVDVLGSLVHEAIIEHGKAEIDLGGLSPGIYFIRFNTAVKRIVKE